jgi:hypothetical protein
MEVEQGSRETLVQEAQYKRGIRNVVMYSLGVALLAIGRWEQVNYGDVERVRQLASQRYYLGLKYAEMTEKVIDCDFGRGKDLRRQQLQDAPYERWCWGGRG